MSDSLIERLNKALAGRYVIERELGEGGMAHRGDGRCVRRREGVRLVVVLVRLRGGGVGSDGKVRGDVRRDDVAVSGRRTVLRR